MPISKNILFIAEIGINHNGDINLAKKLIDEARVAGFHAVKFQKRTIEKVYTEEFLKSKRDSPWGQTQGDQKRGLEFSKDQYKIIDEYCKKINMLWFASAWDNESLKFLDEFISDYAKVASAMIVDKEFLREVSIRKKHTFISTGMSSLNDIDEAVDIFKKNN